MIAIGIDIGGTHTRVGAVDIEDPCGSAFGTHRCATTGEEDGNALIDWIVRAIEQIVEEVEPPSAPPPTPVDRRAPVCNPNPSPERKRRVPTPREERHGQSVDAWTPAANPPAPTPPRNHVGSNRIAGIGLALPGIIDHARRELVQSINVPFLQGRPLAEELGTRTGYPVVLLADTEAATWAEYTAWAEGSPPADEDPRGLKPKTRLGVPTARGLTGGVPSSEGVTRRHVPTAHSSFVHLRIGTGIACGLVVDGQLQRLDTNRSGHLDVLRIDDRPNAPPCPCGKRGCLETIASGRVLQGRAAHAGYSNGLADIQHAWRQGDNIARAIVKETATALAIALQNLIDHFNPEVISIGGGVPTILPCLLDETTRHVNSPDVPSSDQPWPAILPATHGDKAGIIGAALLASLSVSPPT